MPQNPVFAIFMFQVFQCLSVGAEFTFKMIHEVCQKRGKCMQEANIRLALVPFLKNSNIVKTGVEGRGGAHIYKKVKDMGQEEYLSLYSEVMRDRYLKYKKGKRIAVTETPVYTAPPTSPVPPPFTSDDPDYDPNEFQLIKACDFQNMKSKIIEQATQIEIMTKDLKEKSGMVKILEQEVSRLKSSVTEKLDEMAEIQAELRRRQAVGRLKTVDASFIYSRR